jgi:hypothetical protein
MLAHLPSTPILGPAFALPHFSKIWAEGIVARIFDAGFVGRVVLRASPGFLRSSGSFGCFARLLAAGAAQRSGEADDRLSCASANRFVFCI